MKISLIHDWLRVNAGSEKVVTAILALYSDEDIALYTLFNKLSDEERDLILHNVPCRTSWLQFFPGVNKVYKALLPLMPFVIGTMPVRKSDIYLSSSHAIAKGFNCPRGSLHICYCHTPMRYAWYLNEDYLKEFSGIKLWLIRKILPFIRRWDLRSATRVSAFIANSKHIQQQIRNIYQRDSVVIYPPVNTAQFVLNAAARKDFYLAVGRCVPYKKMDIIINAFKRMPERKLVLIGDGYDRKRIKALLKDCHNIVWLGYQHDDELILYMQNARACIFAAKEDFGIMCVEAQATGTPVLALNYGGYKETVIEGKSGYFFQEQCAEAIIEVVEKFEAHPLQQHAEISAHAAFFSAEKFKQNFRQFVHDKRSTFTSSR